MGANQKKLNEVYKVLIEVIRLGYIEIDDELLVVDNIKHDMVLGTDELIKKCIIIDYLNSIIQIVEHIV